MIFKLKLIYKSMYLHWEKIKDAHLLFKFDFELNDDATVWYNV